MSKTSYKLPDSVIEDTRAFWKNVEEFTSGKISPADFKAIRASMGIYEQREDGTYMVRVRGAGGVFLSHQAKLIADLSEEFAEGIIHATTRQNLQIHRVLIHDAPALMERLLEAGLSTQGGGGNTVRNVSACPHAGICSNEAFDVTPYALALTEYLISNPSNFSLPRKFKVAFSGCANDCALSSVTDLGFFAHEKDGIRGFAVYAGGGMGARSALGIQIEEFVPAESIFEIAEAVKRLFDTHGDRTNRHKARLRYVVERLGVEEFRRLYRETLDQVRAEGISKPEIKIGEVTAAPIRMSIQTAHDEDPNYRVWREKHTFQQKQENLYTVHIPLNRGDILSPSLRSIADLAENFGDGTVRTTQTQDLELRGISEDHLFELYGVLKRIDDSLVSVNSIRCVSCTGASRCRLGVCVSKELESAINLKVADLQLPFEAQIKISGCPNSCGHHPVASIGFYGSAMKIDGKVYPAYFLVAGGKLSEGNSVLSQQIAKLPAEVIPDLMREFWTAAAEEHRQGESLDDLIRRWGKEHLSILVEKRAGVTGQA